MLHLLVTSPKVASGSSFALRTVGGFKPGDGDKIKFFPCAKGTEFFSRLFAKIILSPNRKPEK